MLDLDSNIKKTDTQKEWSDKIKICILINVEIPISLSFLLLFLILILLLTIGHEGILNLPWRDRRFLQSFCGKGWGSLRLMLLLYSILFTVCCPLLLLIVLIVLLVLVIIIQIVEVVILLLRFLLSFVARCHLCTCRWFQVLTSLLNLLQARLGLPQLVQYLVNELEYLFILDLRLYEIQVMLGLYIIQHINSADILLT